MHRTLTKGNIENANFEETIDYLKEQIENQVGEETVIFKRSEKLKHFQIEVSKNITQYTKENSYLRNQNFKMNKTSDKLERKLRKQKEKNKIDKEKLQKLKKLYSELRPKLLTYQQTSKRFQVQHLLEDQNNVNKSQQLEKLQEKIQKVKNFEKIKEEKIAQKKGKVFDIFFEDSQTGLNNANLFNEGQGFKDMKGVAKLIFEEKQPDSDLAKRNSFVNSIRGTGY